MRDYIQMLFDYTYWAHKRIWTNCILPLSDEQYRQPLDYSVGSVHNQMVHTMSAEWMWLTRLYGQNPTMMLDPNDFADRDAVRQRWDVVEGEMRAYISTLPEDLSSLTFTYTTTSGKSYTQPVLHILLQLINHGTDHRAQTLAMIHTLGGMTIAQDLLIYLRERL
jgi:uncharacterized damage-inducible protein DinB